MLTLIKSVRGIQIIQCGPVAKGAGARFVLQHPNGAEVGGFTLRPAAEGWQATADEKSALPTLTIDYAQSFAEEVNDGHVTLS